MSHHVPAPHRCGADIDMAKVTSGVDVDMANDLLGEAASRIIRNGFYQKKANLDLGVRAADW